MQVVSDRFLTAIPQPHRIATTITATVPGGATVPLTLSAGTVAADRTQRIRRTATLQVFGGSALFEQLSTPGCVIAVDHGIHFGGSDVELVPQIRGELSSAGLQVGDGLIQVSVADRWQRVAAADYLAPYTPATSARRLDVIATAITDVYTGITIRNTAADLGTIATAQAWTSRADMITALATDAGVDAYFAADGAFVIAPSPRISDQVAWLIKSGPGGTLEQLTRTRPLDRLYNTVILEPATADPAQGWSQVIAQIVDPGNPRHPDRIGVRPYRRQAPTLLTTADAQRVAQQLLAEVQGSTETLALGAITNPALEPGDVVRAATPIDGGNTIVNHLLDSCSIDLASGSMSCATRAAVLPA